MSPPRPARPARPAPACPPCPGLPCPGWPLELPQRGGVRGGAPRSTICPRSVVSCPPCPPGLPALPALPARPPCPHPPLLTTCGRLSQSAAWCTSVASLFWCSRLFSAVLGWLFSRVPGHSVLLCSPVLGLLFSRVPGCFRLFSAGCSRLAVLGCSGLFSAVLGWRFWLAVLGCSGQACQASVFCFLCSVFRPQCSVFSAVLGWLFSSVLGWLFSAVLAVLAVLAVFSVLCFLAVGLPSFLPSFLLPLARTVGNGLAFCRLGRCTDIEHHCVRQGQV
eukprot:SAG31_NODE_316_length_17841_cov_33.716154_13_plen_277_part_00